MFRHVFRHVSSCFVMFRHVSSCFVMLRDLCDITWRKFVKYISIDNLKTFRDTFRDICEIQYFVTFSDLCDIF